MRFLPRAACSALAAVALIVSGCESDTDKAEKVVNKACDVYWEPGEHKGEFKSSGITRKEQIGLWFDEAASLDKKWADLAAAFTVESEWIADDRGNDPIRHTMAELEAAQTVLLGQCTKFGDYFPGG